MRIDVTAADLSAGRRWDIIRSPISLAVMRATGGVWRTGIRCAHTRRGKEIRVRLPAEVVARMAAFDDQQHVEPFSFEMPLEKPVNDPLAWPGRVLPS